jgi:putative ABC transport system ATP-binding protein
MATFFLTYSVIFKSSYKTMDIQLHAVVPVPLKDKLSDRISDIWSKDISFLSGEWIKIVAPSGTGKTTLMNILYKLRHDYEGGG